MLLLCALQDAYISLGTHVRIQHRATRRWVHPIELAQSDIRSGRYTELVRVCVAFCCDAE